MYHTQISIFEFFASGRYDKLESRPRHVKLTNILGSVHRTSDIAPRKSPISIPNRRTFVRLAIKQIRFAVFLIQATQKESKHTGKDTYHHRMRYANLRGSWHMYEDVGMTRAALIFTFETDRKMKLSIARKLLISVHKELSTQFISDTMQPFENQIIGRAFSDWNGDKPMPSHGFDETDKSFLVWSI
jgi:hypothetical protein